MDESGTPFQQTTRMTTRGITRMQYAESPTSAAAIDSSTISFTTPVSASYEFALFYFIIIFLIFN